MNTFDTQTEPLWIEQYKAYEIEPGDLVTVAYASGTELAMFLRWTGAGAHFKFLPCSRNGMAAPIRKRVDYITSHAKSRVRPFDESLLIPEYTAYLQKLRNLYFNWDEYQDYWSICAI